MWASPRSLYYAALNGTTLLSFIAARLSASPAHVAGASTPASGVSSPTPFQEASTTPTVPSRRHERDQIEGRWKEPNRSLEGALYGGFALGLKQFLPGSLQRRPEPTLQPPAWSGSRDRTASDRGPCWPRLSP